MQALCNWGLLPHTVLQRVISFLPDDDARNASLVCHNWRRSAYTVNRIWKSIRIDLTQDCFDYHRVTWNQLHKFHSIRSVHHLTICINSHCKGCIESLCQVVHTCALVNFEGIRSFSLRPTNSGLYFNGIESSLCDTMQRLCRSLLALVTRSRRLRHLSLGLTDGFDGWQNKLLHHLQQHRSLRSLHLGSLRSDPVSCRVPFIDTRLLRCFHLCRLGLDLNQVSEELVSALARSARLQQLSVFVHDDVTPGMPALGVQSWPALAETGCQVAVTMVHSPSGMQHCLAVLPRELPLSHLRLYFCQRLHPRLFDHLCASFGHRLRSFRLADCMEEAPNFYGVGAGGGGAPDPLVMLAWLCPSLHHLAVYGYWVSVHTLVGLAALRGGGGGDFTLEVPSCCVYLDEHGDALLSGDPYGKISHWLGYHWEPVPDAHLPDGLFDSTCCPEDLYIDALLNEQDCDRFVDPD